MRVLFLTHNYPRFAGDPSGSFIEELVNAMPEDIEVHVLRPHASGLPEIEQRQKATLHSFRYASDREETLAYEGKMLSALKQGIKGLRLLEAFVREFGKAAKRLSASLKIDILHAHWLIPAGLAAKNALRHSAPPLVVSAHGTDVRLAETKIWSRILSRELLKSASLTLPVSAWLAEKLKRLFGENLKTEVLSMPASEIFCAPPRKMLIRRIVAVGNLTIQKRFNVLIDALDLLYKEGLKPALDIVGTGDELEKLTIQAKTLGVDVQFLGKLPHHALPETLKESGILVLPSVAEGFGLSMVEAQLAGLAVIGADAGGQGEIIEHKKTGLLVPPDNPKALAQSIKKMLNNPEWTLQLAAEGQRQAKNRFLPVPTAKRLATIYEELLK